MTATLQLVKDAASRTAARYGVLGFDADACEADALSRAQERLGVSGFVTTLESARAWAWAVARGAVVDFVRRRKRHREAEGFACEALSCEARPQDDPARIAESEDTIRYLREAVKGASREAFDLALQGHTEREIADVMGTTRHFVRTALDLLEQIEADEEHLACHTSVEAA